MQSGGGPYIFANYVRTVLVHGSKQVYDADMADESISESPTSRKSQLISLAAGFLIAGLGFALLWALMAYLIPLWFKFDASPRSRLLMPLAVLFISVGGLMRYLRGRAKRVQTRASAGPTR